MNNDILEKYKLERSLPTKAAKAFEKLLEEANESYVLLWQKEKTCKIRGFQFWNFTVYCPKTNFADAFFHLGLRWNSTVLPEWDKYIYGNKLKTKTKAKRDKCQSCKKNNSVKSHTCPYKSDVNDDDTLCNCCNDCRQDCIDAI